MAITLKLAHCQHMISVSFFLAAGLTAQVPRNQEVSLKNWPAPQLLPAATQSGSLVFIAISPCRVVDTRAGQGFAPPFGPPSLIANATRSFPIQLGVCSIPSVAQAYSFNVTAIPPGPLGYLTIWPTGQPQPNAVTLDDITGDIRNNAAIVLAGTPNGSVDVHVNADTDLAIDINGYYAPSSGTVQTNTAIGLSALASNTTGFSNMAIGYQALTSNTSGLGNTASGYGTLFANTLGYYNTADGLTALQRNATGFGNTASGVSALFASTGNRNSAFGFSAGSKLQGGDNNLYLGNPGQFIESNVIRLGTGNGDIAPAHTKFFVAAVRGVMTGVGDAVNVVIDSGGQLGTINSSRRFKEDIQDMADASSGLLRLRPVTYRYQKPYADGAKPRDYGLIAEEVAEVYPDLVVKSTDGQIETVQYHKLIPMLLNEVQKLQAQVMELREALNGQH